MGTLFETQQSMRLHATAFLRQFIQLQHATRIPIRLAVFYCQESTHSCTWPYYKLAYKLISLADSFPLTHSRPISSDQIRLKLN